MENQSRNDSVSVGVTQGIIADERSEDLPRSVLCIKNMSTGIQHITLSFGASAISGAGIVLNTGESVIDSTSEGYQCWQGSISAISNLASGTLAIFER